MNPLFALAAASFATGTQAFVFAGLLAEVAADLGVSVGAAGQLSTAFALASAVAAPVLGGLLGRAERRGTLFMALLLVAGLNVVAALAPDFQALLGLRVLAALAGAVVNPLASAAAVALSPPEQRGRALAVVTGGLTLAFTLGIPLGSAVGGAFGWRATFLFAGGMALLGALVLRLGLPRLPAPQAARPPMLATLRLPGVLSMLGLTFLGFAATFCVVAYLGPVVNAATGLSGAAVGPFQAGIGLGSLLGVLLGGWLADARRARAGIIGLYLAMAVVLLGYVPLIAGQVAAAAPWLGLVIVSSATILFALIPLVQSRLVAAAPQAGPVLFGLNGTMVYAGQGMGALLGGLVTLGVGLPATGVVGAAVAGLGALLAARAIRRPGAA